MGSRTLLSKLMGSSEPIEPMLKRPLLSSMPLMHETWYKDHQTIEKAEHSPKLLPGSKPTSLGQKHHCTGALKNISVPSDLFF